MAWFFSKISNMMDFFFVEKVSLVKKGQIITVHFLQVDKPSENRLYDYDVIISKKWGRFWFLQAGNSTTVTIITNTVSRLLYTNFFKESSRVSKQFCGKMILYKNSVKWLLTYTWILPTREQVSFQGSRKLCHNKDMLE